MVAVSKRERGRLSTVLRNRTLENEARSELKDKLPPDALAVDCTCSNMSDDKIAWVSFSSRTTMLEEIPTVSEISDGME